MPQSDEIQRFGRSVEAAIAADPLRARRLRRINAPLSIATNEDSITLVPDGTGVTLVPGHGSAAREVRFREGSLDRFTSGRLSLSTALLEGEAAAEGPVRDVLGVAPILSGLLRATAEHRPAVPAQEQLAQPREVPSDMWAVEVRGLKKRFGSTQVLDGLDLKIPAGAITVVLGPSGTGKSVLLKHMIGLLRPDQGEVLVHGRTISELSASQLLELRRGYGVLFQDGALFSSMSVYDNVAFPLRQHTDLPEAVIERVVTAHLEEVGLGAAAGLAPSALSGGMRKRIGFARALVLEPEIVLFDEPDSGLDPVRTSLLSELIVAMHPRYGGTYLVITHNIEVARKLGEYLALIWNGRVVVAGTRDAVFGASDPFVRQFLAGDPDGPLGME